MKGKTSFAQRDLPLKHGLNLREYDLVYGVAEEGVEIL